MSQYPNVPSGPPPQLPYSQGYGPPRGNSGPGRRAGILMLVLGGLGLFCGGFSIFFAKNWDFVMASQPPAMRANLPAEANPASMMYQGEIVLGISVLLAALGIGVLRGGKASMIAGAIVTGLLAVNFLLGTVGAVELTARGNAMAAPMLCVSGFITIVFGLQVVWLIQSVRAKPQIPDPRAMHDAQYMQYLQQQQAHQAALYQQYNQNPYNAPAATAQPGEGQTGWQMPAPPPAPPSEGGAGDETA